MTLESVSKEVYGDNYDSVVLEQWKTCVEMANSNTEKRTNSKARRKILCKRFSTKSRPALRKRSSLTAGSLASSISPRPGWYARRLRRECRPGGGGS